MPSLCSSRQAMTKIPNISFLGSRDSDVRVFVEREPGVRENEPVMRWISWFTSVCRLILVHLNNTETISVRTLFVKTKENTFIPQTTSARALVWNLSRDLKYECLIFISGSTGWETHHKDDLWTESRAMQEMLVDTCRLSVEFSPQSMRVSIIGGYVRLNNPSHVD